MLLAGNYEGQDFYGRLKPSLPDRKKDGIIKSFIKCPAKIENIQHQEAW